MARDIGRKLRATAAALGLLTHKELAAAFRRVNPATGFDLGRAEKWLQNRAAPRDARVYQDWALVLDMECSADWIANSPIDSFLDAVAARHGSDRSGLARLSTSAQKRQDEHSDLRSDLAGSWVCYSNAWSPYFRGQIVRGSLSVAETKAETERPVTYMESLPTGELRLEGTLSLGRRALHMSLRECSGDTRFMFCLFPPNSPATVLGGLMCGATILGPGPAPSVSRVIAVRLPACRKSTATGAAYLAQGGSIADDLTSLGLPVSRPTVVDEELVRFLGGGDGCGLDQPSAAGFRAIVELFDREWLTRIGEMTNATVSNGPPFSDG